MSEHLTSARAGEDLATVLSRCAEANAAAHFERWDVRLETTASPDQVRIEWPDAAAGPDALPTASIRRGDAWVRVHSARRPMDEARRFVQQELGDRVPDVVCVVGAGLGYVVDVLLERGETRVFVLEPEPALVPWLLARRDWREAITSARLLVVPGPTYEQRMSAWQMLTPLPDSIPVIANRVICDARPEAAEAARSTSTFVLRSAAANEVAGDRFRRVMLLNTLRNLPIIAREAPVESLLAAFPRKPAVLAGAGPSLNRNIEELRPYRDRVVLIAVGTALKPLVAAGMPPDFVVAVDPGAYTPQQFAGVVAPSTFLVSEPCVEPAVFEGFAGRTFVFRLGKHEPWPWLLEQGYDPGVIRSWGTVLTSALHLGVLLGCDPLLFIGTDLSYTNGQSHALNSFTHGWVEQWVNEGTPVQEAWTRLRHSAQVVEDGMGGPCETSVTMVQFRDWIRHESCVLPMRFVNVTGAGILTGGRVELGALDELLARAPELANRTRRVERLHEGAYRPHRLLNVASSMALEPSTGWVVGASPSEIEEAIASWRR